MTTRYDIVDPMLLYQQQKSHYEHIWNPRATIKIDHPPRKAHSLYHNTKSSQVKDRERKRQNRKMLMSLLDIYNNKPGILSKQYETFCPKPSSSLKRKTFYSTSYKKQEQEIKKQNNEMMHHIVKVQPIIGNKKEWSKHYEQHLEMEKKLRTHNKELFNLKEFRDQLTRGKKTRLVKLDQKEERLNQTQKQKGEQMSTKKLSSKKKSQKKKEKKVQQVFDKGQTIQLSQTVPN